MHRGRQITEISEELVRNKCRYHCDQLVVRKLDTVNAECWVSFVCVRSS
jgi:hypothetical protein